MSEKKTLSSLEKLMQTPFERGFACMAPDTCELCIKAAVAAHSTTPCEDELESDLEWSQSEKNKRTFALGIYSTPHCGKSTPHEQMRRDLYRAILRFKDGGILSIPFPCSDIDRLEIQVQYMSRAFDAELIGLCDDGVIYDKQSNT